MPAGSFKNGRTSARYVRSVVVPCEDPAHPPALQDTGAFKLPRIDPVIPCELKKPFCPANADFDFSTVCQYKKAATTSAPAGTPEIVTFPDAKPFTPKPRRPTPPMA